MCPALTLLLESVVGVLVHQTLKVTSRRALGSQEALAQTVTAPGSSDQGVTRRKSNKASLHVVSNPKWQVLCLSLGSWGWWGGLARGQRSPRKQVNQIQEPTLAPNTRLPLPGCSLSRQSSTLLWNWRPWHSGWSVKGRGQGEVGLGCPPIWEGQERGNHEAGVGPEGKVSTGAVDLAGRWGSVDCKGTGHPRRGRACVQGQYFREHVMRTWRSAEGMGRQRGREDACDENLEPDVSWGWCQRWVNSSAHVWDYGAVDRNNEIKGGVGKNSVRRSICYLWLQVNVSNFPLGQECCA